MAFVRAAVVMGVLVAATGCGANNGNFGTPVTTVSTQSTTTVVAHKTSGSSTCASIGFTPNSDDVAGGIEVKGVSCETAEPVIRAVKGNEGKDYTANSFSCVVTGQSTPDQLASFTYTCIGPAGPENQTITFHKS